MPGIGRNRAASNKSVLWPGRPEADGFCPRALERADEAGSEGATMDDGDWRDLIEPFSEEREVVVFHLGDLTVLDSPVVNDVTGVRGAWYHTVGDLQAAASLSELAERAERMP